jgi:hypothetical protein
VAPTAAWQNKGAEHDYGIMEKLAQIQNDGKSSLATMSGLWWPWRVAATGIRRLTDSGGKRCGKQVKEVR